MSSHDVFPLSLQHHFDLPLIEDPQPNEAGWLIHSKTLQSYLSLLGSSQQEETQEACCGALQNLTTNESTVSCKNMLHCYTQPRMNQNWISSVQLKHMETSLGNFSVPKTV